MQSYYYYYLLLLFVVCRLSSNSRELEWARNLKLGPMIGNDVHQLLLKYEPSQPHGSAVTKAWKCIFGKAMPLTPLVWLTWNLTHMSSSMCSTTKLLGPLSSTYLDFLLISMMWKTGKWIELLKDLIYQHRGMKRQISIIISQIGQKTWPTRTNVFLQWVGLRNDWP